jgi:DNA topoisomerase-2
MLTNNNNNSIKIEPYYRGFKGKIMRLDNNSNNLQESNCCRYLIKGVYEIDTTDKIKITELPVGTWTQDYKELLEGLMNPTSNQKDQKRDPKRDQKKSDKPSQPLIKDYVDMSTDTTVEFIVTLYPGMLEQLMSELYDYNVDGVEKMFRLYTTASTNNMHLFNSQEQLTKYDTVEAIIDEYYTVRLEYYGMRRKYLIERLKQELVELSNLAKYIQYTLDDKIDLRKKSGDAINQMLETMGFDKLSDKSSERMTYNYLIKKPMDIVTDENVAKIMRDRDAKQLELDSLTGKTPEQLWLHELHELKKSYLEYIVTPVNDTSSQPTKSTKGKTKSKK